MGQAVSLNTAWLLTGGNLGNRESNLAIAYTKIEQECGVVNRASSLYETAAWGKNDQPPFLNQVLEIHTLLTPQVLLNKILTIEKVMGRTREEKFGPRLIDIDILLFNDETLYLPSLKIPHPELQNRRFVLVPLVEIASDIVHPGLKKTMAELLASCPDTLDVSLYVK